MSNESHNWLETFLVAVGMKFFKKQRRSIRSTILVAWIDNFENFSGPKNFSGPEGRPSRQSDALSNAHKKAGTKILLPHKDALP